MVFPSRLLDELGSFQGVSTDLERYIPRILDPSLYEYRLREEVEEDPEFKQIIPYVLMRCAGRYLRYRRGKELGEKRLQDLYSIGIGGHICRHDVNLFEDAYEEAVRRELAEEVRIDSACAERKVALINDDATEVGRVHFGIVHLLELESPSVRKRERSICEITFLAADELKREPQRYETWSRFLIEDLLATL